jgi:hypothetical protein
MNQLLSNRTRLSSSTTTLINPAAISEALDYDTEFKLVSTFSKINPSLTEQGVRIEA